ncbi:MAG: sensor histidine kinase [Actinomycetota bacterium]|nr:sensor histidine kinase [Actinomycetota bacterium]
MPRTLAEIVREKTDLADHEIEHLTQLLVSWQLIADLSFADLLLWCRLADGEGYICVAQMRPYTAQTLHPEDLFGKVLRLEELPVVDRAYHERRTARLDEPVLVDGMPVRIEGVPVTVGGKVAAVMTKEGAPLKHRRLSHLEQNYLECAAALSKMVEEGSFPFPGVALDPELAPRVGDGMIRLNPKARVVYASPNAVSAYRRLGVVSNIEGQRLDELGVDSSAVSMALTLGVPVEADVEAGDSVVLQRVLPLLAGSRRTVTGALLLLRDVTQLRHREREIRRQESVVREVHHRVKNNLQTIASLLRLQARRLPLEGKQELEEAIRRIASIALVHETLSKDATQNVDFEDVARRLVKMVAAGLLGRDAKIKIELEGHPGTLHSELATPMAVVLVELLQNAVKHAFGPGGGEVKVALRRHDGRLEMKVEDNGRGLKEGYGLGQAGLGLQIVRELVESELGGVLSMRSDGGTRISVDIPAERPARLRPSALEV